MASRLIYIYRFGYLLDVAVSDSLAIQGIQGRRSVNVKMRRRLLRRGIVEARFCTMALSPGCRLPPALRPLQSYVEGMEKRCLSLKAFCCSLSVVYDAVATFERVLLTTEPLMAVIKSDFVPDPTVRLT